MLFLVKNGKRNRVGGHGGLDRCHVIWPESDVKDTQAFGVGLMLDYSSAVIDLFEGVVCGFIYTMGQASKGQKNPLPNYLAILQISLRVWIPQAAFAIDNSSRSEMLSSVICTSRCVDLGCVVLSLLDSHVMIVVFCS